MINGASDRLSREEFIPAEELFDLFEAQIDEELGGTDDPALLREIAEMRKAARVARELYRKDQDPDHFFDSALENGSEWLIEIAGALQTGDSSDLAI